MPAIIRVTLSRKALQIEPGQQGELTVTIQNLSEIVDQYIVEVEGLDRGWFTVSPPRVSLFPQDEEKVTVKLHPPLTAPAGRVDFAVKVVSRENPVEWSRAKATLDVTPVFLFDLRLSPQRQTIIKGDGNFTVELTNPGNVELTLNLSASDPEEGCTYRFRPAQATIEAGGTTDVALTVTPEQRPRDQAKLYNFTVKATPVGAPERARTSSGQLECQAQVVSLDIGLWPQRRSAVGAGKFQVQLDNRGNTDLTLVLEGTDPEEACGYKFEPPQVTLGAGESRSLDLTVAPFGQPPAGEAKTYDFTVKAVPQEAPHQAQHVSGQFECRPKIVSFDLELSPARTSARQEGSFVVRLRNRANTEVSLQLSAADSDPACDLTFDSRCVRLGAGQRKDVALTVRPRGKPPSGETTVCRFSVEAVPDEGRHLSQAAEAELELVRSRRRWQWGVGAALLLLAGVCAFVRFSLLVDWDWTPRGLGGEQHIEEPAPAEEELIDEFWSDPDVIPRGDCTILRWWAGRPDVVVVAGPGVGLEIPFDGEIGVGAGVEHFDVWPSGRDLEGEVEVCPEESTEYRLEVYRDGERDVFTTFVAVEQ